MIDTESILSLTYEEVEKLTTELFEVSINKETYLIDISKEIILDNRSLMDEKEYEGERIILTTNDIEDATIFIINNIVIKLKEFLYSWTSDASVADNIKILVSRTQNNWTFNLVVIDKINGNILLDTIATQLYEKETNDRHELFEFVDIHISRYSVRIIKEAHGKRKLEIIKIDKH